MSAWFLYEIQSHFLWDDEIDFGMNEKKMLITFDEKSDFSFYEMIVTQEMEVLTLKGEVQSRMTIISKERVKISLQIGAKIMKIG